MLRAFLVCALLFVCSHSWESSLYPSATWTPGYEDSEGRFLHDYSYAGYHQSEIPLPQPPYEGNLIDVTESLYSADPTGTTDSTAAIQQAIDKVSDEGGGTVFMPEGRYLISLPTSSNRILQIRAPNVVLKGAGRDKTYLEITTTNMRARTGIYVNPSGGGDWYSGSDSVAITSNLTRPTNEIPVDSTSNYKVGDWIVVRTNMTDEFIEEHQMTGGWSANLRGNTYLRKVTAIKGNTLHIDIPTRYYILLRDNPRVYKVKEPISEVGIEDFSIGNRENPNDGNGDNDYTVPGTMAYQVHSSEVIEFVMASNCWIRRVSSFLPTGNAQYHILSNAIQLTRSRGVTIEDCNMEHPQYRGGGGNGYAYTLQGSDNLIIGCDAATARHAYDFKQMLATGNVLFNSKSRDARLASDFHMWLSCCNAFDSMIMDGDNLEAKYRNSGAGDIHGWPTTESVFWNTIGRKYRGTFENIVDSRQYGHGYVIGTQGVANQVQSTPLTQNGKDSFPEDLVEGVGNSSSLFPQSLWLHQLSKRMATLPPPEGLTNLISGETFLSSSPLRSDHPVEHLWDGCLDFSPQCTTGTADANNFTVEFDLKGSHNVSHIRVFGDATGTWVCNQWSSSYKVNEGDQWQTINENSNCFSNLWYEQKVNTRGRYFRFVFEGKSGTSVQVTELQLWGVTGDYEEVSSAVTSLPTLLSLVLVIVTLWLE